MCLTPGLSWLILGSLTRLKQEMSSRTSLELQSLWVSVFTLLSQFKIRCGKVCTCRPIRKTSWADDRVHLITSGCNYSSVLSSARNSQLWATWPGGRHVVRCHLLFLSDIILDQTVFIHLHSSSLVCRSIGVITYILWVMFYVMNHWITTPLSRIWSKAKFLCTLGWVVHHHFWARPNRRLWRTFLLSTMTLMKNISATPASWPRTSYAVCWSRIQSKKYLHFILFSFNSEITLLMVLTVILCNCFFL